MTCNPSRPWHAEVFGSGQTSMFITDATGRGPANGTFLSGPPVLDAMDRWNDRSTASIRRRRSAS